MSLKLHDKLRSERLKHKFTLREMAEAMRITAPYLHDMENGRRRYTEQMQYAFVRGLEKLGATTK